MKINFNPKFYYILIIFITLAIVAITTLVLILRNSKLGAIVSNGRDCAKIGGRMLHNGGSAVDAAITTALCEGVILPHSLGVGGGFIATIYSKSKREIKTIIARESAPAASTPNMYVGKNVTGAIAAAVPGEFLGYYEMHKKYGVLPWKDLFEPIIKLCKEGHYVSQYLANVIAQYEKEIREEPSMAEIFVKEDGTLYKEGDFMKRLQLGKTFEIIAQNGVDEFYGGELGKKFSEDVQAMGGIITLQDLKDYRVVWGHKPISVDISGHTLYTTPLPSSGPVLVFMFNVLNGFFSNDKNINWHRVVETFKHAYGLRSNLADMTNEPEMAPKIFETLNKLLNKDFALHIRTLIADNRTSKNVVDYGANFTLQQDFGTANLAVLAPNGDAITITSTVNTYFGGKVRSRRTGIILNDEMDDFSTPNTKNTYGVPASPANYIRPGKRPMSSMCPSIILDKNGDVRMLVGAAGGTKITTSVAVTIIKYIIFNENISRAIDDPRLHHQLAPMRVDLEAGYPENIKNYLKSVGHEVRQLVSYDDFGAVTAISIDGGIATPHYDRRRAGSTLTL